MDRLDSIYAGDYVSLLDVCSVPVFLYTIMSLIFDVKGSEMNMVVWCNMVQHMCT